MHITPAAVYHSMNDMRRMHHLAHQGASALTRLQRFEHLIGKSGFASSLIRPTEPLAADCTNQEHRPWTSRTGERTDSFYDLFDAAVPLGGLAAACRSRPLLSAEAARSALFPHGFYGHTHQKVKI